MPLCLHPRFADASLASQGAAGMPVPRFSICKATAKCYLAFEKLLGRKLPCTLLGCRRRTGGNDGGSPRLPSLLLRGSGGAAGEQPLGACAAQRQMPSACWYLLLAAALPGCPAPHHLRCTTQKIATYTSHRAGFCHQNGYFFFFFSTSPRLHVCKGLRCLGKRMLLIPVGD